MFRLVVHGVMTRDSSNDAARELIALLYEREWASLARVAFLLTDSRHIAEDVVQDAFVRLQATRSRVNNPAAYLRTSVINSCRDIHRHRAVVARAPTPRPEPVIAQHDELFDAIAALPWRQQAALVLRFHIDLTDQAIATALDCRPATVRSLIHRGLASLRKELS
ncbi:MAG: polymerase, sigma-24 subunit, subfamily [Acidimicrobiales bacterium]|nr:polymerase, sigma-24 subunit, subfamily [Acidimicrobiales bacterium]